MYAVLYTYPQKEHAMLRVIEILTNDFGAYNNGSESKVTESVKWTGDDANSLSREYPPSNVWGADQLCHSEIEDCLIRFDYRFEQQLDDGSWVKIDDPRARITPVTEREREIDAENRRLFPGDFEEIEDGCGADYCTDPRCDGQCKVRGYDEDPFWDELVDQW